MQTMTTDIRRALAGKDVLGVLAFLLLVSGMASSSVFVGAGVVLASTVQQLAPAVAGTAFDVLVVAGVYLQAVVLAAVYRTARDVYRTLQRRAKGVDSA